tara:strand:- start:46 stop:255 length:210 start_codon:yes stop_codon:yes gene_type:complete
MAGSMVEPMKLLYILKQNDASNGMPTRKTFSKRYRMQARPDKAWIAPPQKQLLDYQRSIDDLLFTVKQK